MENVKGATYARQAVADISTNRNRAARVKMAQLVQTHGNYDAAGLAVWTAYQAAGCPMNYQSE